MKNGRKNDTYRKYGTNWSTVTNTLIEMGFMSNPEEDRKMASDEYQNKMVTGIVNGIEKYFREK
ncbi:N-acetylmuramoyl-L-alanine amidase [uncultured Campylobacter sp.]|uniref:N-acetylmuramoyl-L-alanine amidase family protein n=1 Tax=uncultured Campylobacter sp. TaxID=218934 RepID=UPI002623ED89|nr:N-acetylmuramoyl-L-alanine amidase [uncultured Campylobacter sp.]